MTLYQQRECKKMLKYLDLNVHMLVLKIAAATIGRCYYYGHFQFKVRLLFKSGYYSCAASSRGRTVYDKQGSYLIQIFLVKSIA